MTDSGVPSPKHAGAVQTGQAAFYPYYAGFSGRFAKATLANLSAKCAGLVFDPWNGAGTTTAACAELGLEAYGSDLNPVMVVVAKGRLLAPKTSGSIAPLAKRVVDFVKDEEILSDDPLNVWFRPDAARVIRNLELAVFKTLVAPEVLEGRQGSIVGASDLACFFYIGLFNVVRTLLAPLRSSNPTWMRRPAADARIGATRATVASLFDESMSLLTDALVVSTVQPRKVQQRLEIALGDSSSIPLEKESVSTVLTSPPYCTRIDYAIATAGELALIQGAGAFDTLRLSLMGTAKIRPTVAQSLLWGPTCLKFLEDVYEHSSVASKSYYYKSHCQYFDLLYRSIEEIGRVLKPGGNCALVVQNSHYKEVLNDLPTICIEMAEGHGLALSEAHTFDVKNSFSRLNSRATKYSEASARVEREEVVILERC